MSAKKTSYSLLLRARDLNDQDAWSELYQYYRLFIFYILQQFAVAPDDIDDLTQEVLVTLTNKINSYDPKQGRFRSWLSGIIRNTYLKYRTKQQRTNNHVNSIADHQEIIDLVQNSQIDELIEAEWRKYITNVAFQRVSEKFQGQAIEVFKLGLKGKSAEEIAEATDLKVSSVYTLRKRVKKLLMLEIKSVVDDLEYPQNSSE